MKGETRFRNLVEKPMADANAPRVGMWDFFFKKIKDRFPERPIPTVPFKNPGVGSKPKITWFGHSTVLFQFKNLNIITDPVFVKKRIGPLFFGPKAFPYSNTYEISDLPKIDIIIISHNHYDHLDKGTVQKLKDSTFLVPKGVKEKLTAWSIKNVQEFAWYESTLIEDIEFTFAPTQHFSGRTLSDQRHTLGGSWVIKGGDNSIYYGADSGYFDEFKEIGKRYGPFDIVLLDCGQYNPSWHYVHMYPKEVIKAGSDLNAKAILPIHNSKFVLSMHPWYEPLERVSKEAKLKNAQILTPQIGETFELGTDRPIKDWWQEWKKKK